MTKILPMLAHDYKKRGHDIVWPAYVQPKLNGVRCLAHKVDKNNIWYISRGGKNFVTLDHLTPYLLDKMKIGDIFDGELFSKDLSFEEIVSAVKRVSTQNPDVLKLEYWVYDCTGEKAFYKSRTYEERLDYILEVLGPYDSNFNVALTVPTFILEDEKQFLEYHSRFVRDGFEGTMVRNCDGLYSMDKRSVDLQKYKDFIDEEFLIVGGRSGGGKEVDCVVFICKTEDGKQFECRPRGTYDKRKVWFKDLDNIIGKKLTVRYQNRSGGNVPIFPVGIEVRDYE